MLKNERFTKLIIFKIFYEIFAKKETVIIAIVNVFFNYLDFFEKIMKTYFELRSA